MIRTTYYFEDMKHRQNLHHRGETNFHYVFESFVIVRRKKSAGRLQRTQKWDDGRIKKYISRRNSRGSFIQWVLHNLEINFSCLLTVIIRESVRGCTKKRCKWWWVKSHRDKNQQTAFHPLEAFNNYIESGRIFLWQISIPKWFICLSYKQKKNKFSLLSLAEIFYFLTFGEWERHNAETATLIIHALPFLSRHASPCYWTLA